MKMKNSYISRAFRVNRVFQISQNSRDIHEKYSQLHFHTGSSSPFGQLRNSFIEVHEDKYLS